MRQTSINIVQLAVALLIMTVLIALVLPMFGSPRINSRHMQNSTQLRGIHQGLVTFANSNKNWFPGINPDGTTLDLRIEYRYQILLEGDYITPDYAINPSETELITEWDEWADDSRPVTKTNYSYAMLQIPEDEHGRRSEWGQTLNSQAVVMSDRNTGISGSPTSVHTTSSQSAWSGGVLWNDNHVMFETVDTFLTKYGGGAENPSDKLFEAAGDDDAYLIHAGN